MYEIVKKSANFIYSKWKNPIKALAILGSGLGDYALSLMDSVAIPYEDIPGFPSSTVVGHAGELRIGYCKGVPTAIMRGRFHAYEGYRAQEIVLPVRAMHLLGAETLVATNAAGGINLSYQPGDLMVITDHINLSGINPLEGPNMHQLGTRFPNMTAVYTPLLREKFMHSAALQGITLQEGVYAMMQGPSFETPAEIRMLRTIGADAVGMSTVPEVIAAVHCGMQVIGISCISNMAAGILNQPLTHIEVLETTQQVSKTFAKCLDILFENCINPK